jgi:hypothetical protein
MTKRFTVATITKSNCRGGKSFMNSNGAIDLLPEFCMSDREESG